MAPFAHLFAAELTIELVCAAASRIERDLQATKLLEDAFKVMDKYEDHTITCTDLRLVLGNMGDLNQDELDVMIEELDPDDIGRVFLDDVKKALFSKIKTLE